MTLLDPDTDQDRHILTRASSELIAWFATVDPHSRPHQVPAWFGWRDRTAAVFSAPSARKVVHLRSNTACRLGLETADGGNDVVIIEGAAHLLERDDARPLADAVGFIEKYSELMGDGGFEQWSATFSVPIRIDVARVLAWDKQTGELRFRDAR